MNKIKQIMDSGQVFSLKVIKHDDGSWGIEVVWENGSRYVNIWCFSLDDALDSVIERLHK